MNLRKVNMPDGSWKLQTQVGCAYDPAPIGLSNIWKDIPEVQFEEEKSKRDVITAFANVYDDRIALHVNRDLADEYGDPRRRIECVKLHEIPEGAVVVTREMLAKAWDNHVFPVSSGYRDRASGSVTFRQFCKEIGFGEVKE